MLFKIYPAEQIRLEVTFQSFRNYKTHYITYWILSAIVVLDQTLYGTHWRKSLILYIHTRLI